GSTKSRLQPHVGCSYGGLEAPRFSSSYSTMRVKSGGFRSVPVTCGVLLVRRHFSGWTARSATQRFERRDDKPRSCGEACADQRPCLDSACADPLEAQGERKSRSSSGQGGDACSSRSCGLDQPRPVLH